MRQLCEKSEKGERLSWYPDRASQQQGDLDRPLKCGIGWGIQDILVEIAEEQTGIVIELKYAERGALEQGCNEVVEQVFQNRYGQALTEFG